MDSEHNNCDIQAEKRTWNRHNVTIEERVHLMGTEMAQNDRRSFSNLVNVLIAEEYARRKATKQAHQEVPA